MDTNFIIALNLPYPDVAPFCRSAVGLSYICNDDNFWSLKLKRDFPNHIKINISTTYRQEYRIAYETTLDQFKQTMKMINIENVDVEGQLEHAGEISFYKYKISYPYAYNEKEQFIKFTLREDLFVCEKGLFGEEVEGLYPDADYLYPDADYLLVYIENPDINININEFVLSGKAQGITQDELEDLDLSKYKYAIPGTYYQPTQSQIREWTMLGLIYRIY